MKGIKQAVFSWKQMSGTVTISLGKPLEVRKADPRIHNWHQCNDCGLINANNHRQFYWVSQVRGKFLCEKCARLFRLKCLK